MASNLEIQNAQQQGKDYTINVDAGLTALFRSSINPHHVGTDFSYMVSISSSGSPSTLDANIETDRSGGGAVRCMFQQHNTDIQMYIEPTASSPITN